MNCISGGGAKASKAGAIERRTFEGRADNPKTWEPIEKALEETWAHESGALLKITMLAVDTGDQATTVYEWVTKQDQSRVIAVKGKRGFDINAPVTEPTSITIGGKKKAVRLRSVMGDVFKAELYRNLGMQRPTDEQITAEGFPPGWVHVPDYLNDEWCKQLVAERRVRSTSGAFIWKREHANEALDCRVYSRAALWIAGAARWTPRKWKDIRERLLLDHVPTEAAPRAPPAQTIRQAPARKVVRSNYMG